MAGPWEKYAAQTQDGPWTKYASQSQPGQEVVATTEDGGVVYRASDGTMSYSSPGYATNDQARIEQIMQGAKPVDLAQSDIDKERIAQSPIYARATQVAEGVPFVGSYYDEALSAAAPSVGQAFRQTADAMRREKPGQSTALNIVGAVAGAAPMALAAGPTIIGNTARTLGSRALAGLGVGAGVGATEGAIYGAGEQGGEGRAANAQRGAIFGGVAGGALGAAAPYVSEGIKRAISRLRGSDVGIISKHLGVSTPAARVIKSALDAGNIDDAATAFARAGGNAMLADAGQPARQLLDAAANTGGAAGRIVTDAVEGRATGASKSLTKALDAYLGAPSGKDAMARSVREGTSAAREAAYSAAYSKPIDYASPRGAALESLLKRVPKSAFDDANSLMAAEGNRSAQIMARVADDGTVTLERLPDVRQLDYITRALKGVADKADGQGKLGGTTPLGRAYGELATNIRNVLKGAVPEYRKALDTAADAISRVKAGETGYTLLRPGTTRETVVEALKSATKAERDAMKEGVRTYIDDAMANVTRALTDSNMDARESIKLLRDLSSRANQQKMRFLLGQKAADAFFAEIDSATTAFELRAALAQNSKTAIRQSIQGSVKQQAAPGALEVLGSGEPVNAAKRFVQLFTGSTEEAQALREAGIYEDIARALTETRGYQAKTALSLVQKAMQGQKLTEQQASFIGVIVAESGVLAGSHEASMRLSTQ